MAQPQTIHPDRFFAGFLAGLRLIHDARLSGNRVLFNRAFYQAVTSSGRAFDVQALEIDYDPLYGVSPWFERQLTRAQRDLLISFPNPSYQVVDIKFGPEQANQLLDQIGNKAAFKELAQAFLDQLTEATPGKR